MLAAALALVMALLVSCGGDGDDEGGTTSSATSSSTATSAPSSSSGTTASSSTTSTTTASTTSSSATSSSSTSTTSGSTTSTSSGTRTVLVYFSTGDGSDCSEVSAFERTVDASIGPALAAFQELVAGPTEAESAAGASSFFSSATADAIRSVKIEGGLLIVDFEDIRQEISNAGTSCGSAAFTASLNRTAFQFPSVDRVRYEFVGSCEDFGGFIQTDICEFGRAG